MPSKTFTPITRRACLAGAAATGLVLALPTRAMAFGAGQDLFFDVYRNGSLFGGHTVRFSKDGARTVVDIAIDLQVKAAFVTFFKFYHTNRETWEDGTLIAIETRTDDNGKSYAVSGAREGDAFIFEGAQGRQTATAGVIPTSYWHPATPRQTELLDTRKGRLITVATAPAGQDRIAAPAGPVEAARYRMTGDLNLDLWYTDQGGWAKCAFEARGSRVDYVFRNGQ